LLCNALVELLKVIDTIYKSELREINEINFARFDAKARATRHDAPSEAQGSK